MFWEREDAEEELIVQEHHSLVVLLDKGRGTTMGARWVLMLEK